MSTKNEEMKYEGLAALIVDQNQGIHKRIDDLHTMSKDHFDKLEAYNTKQNGSITKALEGVANLQSNCTLRKDTCMAAVDELKKNSDYRKIWIWFGKHWKLSIALIFVAWVISGLIIFTAIQQHWVGKLFELIKGVI